MPTVNRTSLNEALARHRREFERLRAVDGADPGMIALVDALFTLLELVVMVVLDAQGLPELRPAGFADAAGPDGARQARRQGQGPATNPHR